MNRSLARLVPALSLAIAAAAHAAGPLDPRLREAVERANAEWVSAMKTGDAAVIAAPYAERGVFVFQDGSTVVGRDAIEKLYRSSFEKKGLASALTIRSEKLEADGDLAYEWGRATIEMRKDGKTASSGGPYLTVWQRQADGSWKIIRNLVF